MYKCTRRAFNLLNHVLLNSILYLHQRVSDTKYVSCILLLTGYSDTVCIQSSLAFENNYIIHFHIGSYVKLCPVVVAILDFQTTQIT